MTKNQLFRLLALFGIACGAWLLLAPVTDLSAAPVKNVPAEVRARIPIPDDLKACVSCARLKAGICDVPGDGCCWCGSCNALDGILTCFFDSFVWIENTGTLASRPGTLKVKWFDLLTCSNKNKSVPVPAIAPGEWTVVSTGDLFYMAKAADGIKLRIEYSDSTGATRYYNRTVKTCPDKTPS